MFSDATREPAGAVQHLSCPSCLHVQLCSPVHDFPTTYASLVEMYSNECTLVDGSPGLLRRETSNAFKRSVPSMKSLLPLKLLSPTLPQSDIWPSSQDQRSTFGAVSAQEYSRINSKRNNPLGLHLSLLSPRPSQRDTPIYNVPGSPLPGRAYYNSDDLCFNCSASASNCEEGCESSHTSAPESEKEFDDGVASDSHTIDAFELSDAPRGSGLPFQCSGENLFPSEAAWLSSPLPNSPRSQLRRRPMLRMPLESHVESWLSDTASEMGQDFLACATLISPKKAHMVEVNTGRLSDENPPPRISAVGTPSSTTLPVGGRYSWASSDDSPPETPTGEREFDDNRSRSPCGKLLWLSPNRRFDLAMNSPPMSPKVFPDPPAASRISFSVTSAGMETDRDPSLGSRWSFNSTMSEHKPSVHIITDLEDIVSSFPSNMLLPDTPCISEVRLRLSNCTSQDTSHNASHFPPESGSIFVNNRHSVANFSHPRRTSGSASSHSTPMVQTTASRSSYMSSTTIQAHLVLPPADLEPLSRIFPNSCEYTRLALYAHIIAYIFITSLPTTSTSAQLDSSPRRRRDTPYWNTPPSRPRAATVLGHPRNPNSYTYRSESGLQNRILDLKSSLQKCIFRLMHNMDSGTSRANDEDRGAAKSGLMLRAAEEVVRGSEKLAFATY